MALSQYKDYPMPFTPFYREIGTVTTSTPANNVVILDNQLARLIAANLTVN